MPSAQKWKHLKIISYPKISLIKNMKKMKMGKNGVFDWVVQPRDLIYSNSPSQSRETWVSFHQWGEDDLPASGQPLQHHAQVKLLCAETRAGLGLKSTEPSAGVCSI